MGFRFRKSFKIAPGVRVNLNAKSTSVRIGPKGLGYTISSTGQKRVTASIPGTGLSYSEVISPKKEPSDHRIHALMPATTHKKRNFWPVVLMISAIIIGASILNNAGSSTNPSSVATIQPVPATPTVTKHPVPLPVQAPVAQPPAIAAPLEIRFVTASSLNMRANPGTNAEIVGKISNGQQISVIEKGDGWLLVQTAAGSRGWVSEQYTSKDRPAPVISRPTPLIQSSTAQASGLSCSPRRTCSQISSCSAARWYLANCSWGGRLDRDNDGRPCEAMC